MGGFCLDRILIKIKASRAEGEVQTQRSREGGDSVEVLPLLLWSRTQRVEGEEVEGWMRGRDHPDKNVSPLLSTLGE